MTKFYQGLIVGHVTLHRITFHSELIFTPMEKLLVFTLSARIVATDAGINFCIILKYI